MKFIILIIVVLSFLILPGNGALLSTGDDDDYFAVSTSIAYGEFPSFSKEFHAGQKMPFASVGPGVLASPFVAVFSIIDRFENAPITNIRNHDNRYWTWSLFGFHFAAYFYLLLGICFLYEMLKLWGTKYAAMMTTLLAVLGGGGLLLYVFRRPVMSHVFESFTVVSAMLLITLTLKKREVKYQDEIVGLSAAFIFLTRYNNAFLSIGLISLYFYIKWKSECKIIIKHVVKTLYPFFIFIFVFRLLPILANGYSSYDQGYAGSLDRVVPRIIDPLFYWVRIGEIFLGRDMGLIYTAPVLVLALISLWLYRKKIPKELLFLSSFCLFNFYFAIVWKSFGSYYGYRYIVFTALPLLTVSLMFLVDDLIVAIGKFKVTLLAFFISYIPLMSVLVFERSGKYGFFRITNSYGVDTYTQPNYHADLLMDLLSNPINPIVQAAKTGFGALFWADLSSEQMLQRIMLYSIPPLLVFMIYQYNRNKSKVWQNITVEKNNDTSN